MTDFDQFKFIIVSEQIDLINIKTISVDPYNHNFFIERKFQDNSGAKLICNNCSLLITVAKSPTKGLIFYISDSNFFRIAKLTCNEIVIKNLLE